MRPNSVFPNEFVSITLQNVIGANSHANGRLVNLQHCPHDLVNIKINIKDIHFYQNVTVGFDDEGGSSGFYKGKTVGARGSVAC
jgi:hypothetical protein